MLCYEGTPFFNFSHFLNRPQKCIRLIAQRLFEMLPDFLFKGGVFLAVVSKITFPLAITVSTLEKPNASKSLLK